MRGKNPLVRPLIEGLEDRRLLSAAVSVVLGADKTLLVRGTNKADTITYTVKGDQAILVTSTSGDSKKVTRTWKTSQVGDVIVKAGSGNDKVSADPGSNPNLAFNWPIIDGEGGNDTLYGNGCLIKGGTGNDYLQAGNSSQSNLLGEAGDDVLVGGKDNDGLHDGAGNDVVLGNGGTDYFVVGSGRNVLMGGKDDDTFVIETKPETEPEANFPGYGRNIIIGGSGERDEILLVYYSVDGQEAVDLGKQSIFGVEIINEQDRS